MIVQRKQFGCITLLFVQVGLALYVIVLFLAPSADGGVKPVVLNVQKVGIAKTTNQATIDTVSSNIHTQLLQSGYNPDTDSDTELSTITAEDRIQIEDRAALGISQAIGSHKVLALGTSGIEESNTHVTVQSAELNIVASEESIESSWQETTATPISFSIYTIGSSPRAPSVIA